MKNISVVLKKTRVFVAIVSLIMFVAIFSDFREFFSSSTTDVFTFLQFVPVLLKTLEVAGWATLGLISVLVLTLLFGRVYCSFLCPLGFLQDLFSRLNKKRRYRFLKSQNWLRWAILAATVISFLFGSILLVNILDPYSNFGRIITYLFKPVVIFLNNGISSLLLDMNIYWLYPDQLIFIGFIKALFPLSVTVLLLLMSVKYGRLFCNTICPVGTLLGEVSRFSVFKVKLNESTCVECGKCAKVCKASCIDVETKTVDVTRCVACFNCLETCKFDAISYKSTKDKIVTTPPLDIAIDKTQAMDKRAFLGAVVGIGLASTAVGQGHHRRQQGNGRHGRKVINPPLKVTAPPGVISIDRFKDLCTACSLCISACPNSVLQPAISEYGWDGLLQPYMDFKTGYCNTDCRGCGNVCPTGAILPLSIEEKQVTQMGIARFEIHNCVVHNDGTDCGACNEHCPTKAVKMVPFRDGLLIPEVVDDLCVGCGACEHACPVDYPYKAIYIEGLEVQGKAVKPTTKKMEAPSVEEDFPF